MRNQIYFGGKPVGPDVRRLEEKFSDRGPGDTVTYEEMSKVLGVDLRSNRFNTVRAAWMKYLFIEKNIACACVPGQGVRLLPEEERTSDGVRTARHGARKIRRGHVKVAAVRLEKLQTEEQKGAALHALRLLDGIQKGAREAIREIQKTIPYQSLPRRKPPV